MSNSRSGSHLTDTTVGPFKLTYRTPGDSSVYLKRNLKDVLPRALNEVCQTRPLDPIEFLARCLYKVADCDLYFQEKAVFEAEKQMLGLKLKKEEAQRHAAILRYKKQISEYREFLHMVKPRRYSVQSRQRHTSTRSAKKKKDVGKKDGSGRTSVSPEPGISAMGMYQTMSSILRNAFSPADESRSVVSLQRDSRSSSRTRDDDISKRSPNTLTSSSRIVSRRRSTTDEMDLKDSPTLSSDIFDMEATSKTGSPARRVSRRRSTTASGDRKKSESLARRKKKSQQEDSITDLTGSSPGIDYKGGKEWKERKQSSRTLSFEDAFPEEMTPERILDAKMQALQRSKKDAKEKLRARRASRGIKSVDRKGTISDEDFDEENDSDTDKSDSEETDEKRKGKRRVAKHKKKSLEDEEEESTYKKSQQIATEQNEFELQIMTSLGKKPGVVSDANSVFSIIKEFSEGEDEYEHKGGTTYSQRINQDISDLSVETDVKGQPRRRTKKKDISHSPDEEVLEAISTTNLRNPPPTRETTPDDVVRKRIGKKMPRLSKRRASTYRKSPGVAVSKKSSDQLIDATDTDSPSQSASVSTSRRMIMADQTTLATARKYTYPFTPIECEWQMVSNNLVCFHPVLGEIRSRPSSTSYATDVSGWSDPATYIWQSVYDHEIYVVEKLYQDDNKHKRKLMYP